jgi:hypothetical protein
VGRPLNADPLAASGKHRMDQDENSSPAVFTPGNEPYLGRRPLLQFDRTIVATLRANRAVAAASRDGDLTDLQRAACQIIPQGVSIGLSIRELIRQGYLFSAFVLLRPLIERAAIVSYLVRHPEAVEHWKNGWKHRERPSLRRMLDAMGWNEVDTSMAKEICEFFGHAVHGDPFSAYWNTIELHDGTSDTQVDEYSIALTSATSSRPILSRTSSSSWP